MKKVKLNSGRLQLNKEKVAALTSKSMQEVNGGIVNAGGGAVGINETNPDNPTARVTRGNCDLHTIGHDDGPNCLSHSDWGWCWCRGM